MRYDILEEAGSIGLRYEGPLLDLMAYGTLQIEMQAIVDRVAIALLAREGAVDVDKPWLMFRGPRRPFIRQRTVGRGPELEVMPVRAMVHSVKAESPLEQNLIFMVPAILADPSVRNILQGIAANIITAVGATGIRGIRSRVRNESSVQQDVVDVAPEFRRVAMALARNANGRRASLRMTHTRRNERFELEFNIEPDES